MKKVVILIFCIFILQACQKTQKNEDIVTDAEKEGFTENIESVPMTTDLPPIPFVSMSSSAFHSVIGWLSNDEIAFILVEQGEWTVQVYSVPADSWRKIYTTEQPIIQASIHPTKDKILLHTSRNSSTAEVQLIHINGQLLDSLTFESDELYMDWHPQNSSLIVFTTFYEDWTYNTFIYDGTTQNLESIEVEDPFVKWYDEEHLMVFRWAESNLDGGELILYSLKEKTLKETGITNVIDAHTNGNSLLVVQVSEETNEFQYSLSNEVTDESIDWTSAAISNYSEWVVPYMDFIDQDKLIGIKSLKPGNLDETTSSGTISSVTFDGKQEYGEIESQPLLCAPNGEVCLGGYQMENWIQLSPLIIQPWINILN